MALINQQGNKTQQTNKNNKETKRLTRDKLFIYPVVCFATWCYVKFSTWL